MKTLRTRFAAFALLLAGLVTAASHPVARAATDSEEAYRRNNIGVALLEQYRHQEAAEAFRSALAVDENLSIARFNLALALFHVPDLAGALREAQAVARQMPASPYPYYLLGLIAKAENRTEDAKAAFGRVLELDPGDVGANVNLGQLMVQLRQYDEAIAMLRRASQEEPFNATAIYNLGMALTRSGDREGGRERIQRFQELRASGYGTLLGQAYMEQGRYAEAINTTGAEPGLVSTAPPGVRFTDMTAEWLGEAAAGGDAVPPSLGRTVKAPDEKLRDELARGLGGQLVLFDADGDADLDLVVVGPEGRRLLVNSSGRLTDTGAAAGWPVELPALAAVAADYDNDTFPDLFFFEYGGGSLYRNDGKGAFADVTAESGIPTDRYLSVSGAFADADHDGDVDLLIAGFADLDGGAGGGPFPEGFAAAPNRLYRNDGDGTFTDVSEETGLSAVPGHALGVVPTDYDNRRDIDFVFARHGAPPLLMRNFRDGAFRDVSEDVGFTVGGAFTAAAAGDVNKDGYTDFYFAEQGGAGQMVLSDGQLRFVSGPGPTTARNAQAAQFLDFDNDGLLDLVTAGPEGLRILRNLGSRFEDASAAVLGDGAPLGEGRVSLASGDLDGDGDTDLVVRQGTGALRVFRNDGAEKHASVKVHLTGRVSNRSGVGSKLEVRAGSLSQKLETYAATPAPAPADVVFGLGERDGADAVRVLWPAGILQTEIGGEAPGSRVASRLNVEELDRKPSSCPYLFTWNGRSFEFVTDFMGGGEMGYWHAPGVRNHPDPEEYVRIRSDQLVERDGYYELRITNELEEALFLDGLRLHVVDHPERTEVFPNEGMVSAPPPFELYALEGLRPVRSARDDRGQDVTRALDASDRVYVDGFELLPIRGYAESHALVLDLGSDAEVLLLSGWTDYAFSSDNVAASHRDLTLTPPRLEVRDATGEWRLALAEVGIPVGRPQTVVVDMAGRWLGPSREVRIVTNMRIYWDQALVAASRIDAAAAQIHVLEPTSAELRWRGFSQETSSDGREPWGYAYASVSWSSPWKVLPGRYTREGDVLELLDPRDDMFVISRPGDEIAVRFDAKQLPALASGWSRTFLLYTDGFSKEMDINSSNPNELGPLPFHGMTRYPYGDEQSYPLTPERLEYMARYNTRVVKDPLPRLAWDVLAVRREAEASGR